MVDCFVSKLFLAPECGVVKTVVTASVTTAITASVGMAKVYCCAIVASG